jgi:homocysteine S-methyltransferase
MTPLDKLLAKLASGPLVADGAMATSLYEKGFYINRSFEELSLTEPQAIKDTVLGFERSGAKVFHTNTFNATIPKLAKYGLQEELGTLISKSSELSRETLGPDAFLIGVVGSLGLLIEPLGQTSREEAQTYFSANFKSFEKTSVDAIAINAIHDLNEMEAALRAAKEHSSKPIFIGIGLNDNLKTSQGHSLENFVAMGHKYDVAAIGICGEVGPSGMLTAIQALRPLTKKPIYALPNAGMPRYVNDQYIYLCSPDYMGKFAKRLALAGANIIGGHCGVYASHIKAIANTLRMASSLTEITVDSISRALPTHIEPIQEKPKSPLPIEQRSQLGAAFKSGKKILTIEVVPPALSGVDKFMEQCAEIEKATVDFVNIPDGARAMARVSSLHLAAMVKQKFKIEPIPHYTCRDRNLIGLQSDLLGAYVSGVRNLLLVTGDPPKLGNNPGATGVYDVDSIGLTHITARMNHGLNMGGAAAGGQTSFMVGVALNPTAQNVDLELSRFKYKIEAGADYAITQPIYNIDTYKKFMDRLGSVNIPIIMGIWPVVSLRNAEFLKNEVPGVDVPDWVLEEMQKAGDNKDDAIQRGLEIAVRTMEEAKNLVAGFQVSAPFNKVDIAVKAIRGVF